MLATLFPLDSLSMSMGFSKLGQILLPLGVYILLREFLFQPAIFTRLLRPFHTGISPERLQQIASTFEQRLARAAGFFSWKVGCDLGFFLVVTQYGHWSRALTWSGLIPFTVTQYLVYRLWGQNLILGRLASRWTNQKNTLAFGSRANALERFFSKFFYEDMNVTSNHVPMIRVVLKSGVDYTSLMASWSIYTMGILFIQSGEVNWSPLRQFPYLPMLAFYLGGYLVYIFGFNLFEFLYLKFIYWQEQPRRWRTAKNHQELPIPKATAPFWKSLHGRLFGWGPWSAKYGITSRWLVSCLGGVVLVALFTIPTANGMIALGNGLYQNWFDQFGRVDPVQLEQVIGSDILEGKLRQAYILPDPRPRLTQDFPRLWQQMFSASPT
jgi:hypothetical protein